MLDKKILLTAEQVAEWQNKKAELERVVAEAQKDLADINQKLEAVAILFSEWGEGASSVQGKPLRPDIGPSMSMIKAVKEIVDRSAPKRLTKAEIKETLREAGYPKERLGNYFYTVIARLKDKGVIIVHEDGSVSSVAHLLC